MTVNLFLLDMYCYYLLSLLHKIDVTMENMTDIQKHDYEQGVVDCSCGIYDKWFRYNHKDDGQAYDLGWMSQNEITRNEKVIFIGLI